MLTRRWRNKSKEGKSDEIQCELMVCLVKAYRLMPPFRKWLTAPVVCLSVCVWEHPSPHNTFPPLSACVCTVCLPLWVRQKQTELSDLCIRTYQSPTHPSTHTQCTYSTVVHQHHPRTLSQTCIWHTKTRLTFEHVHINKCTHIKSMPLAHALSFLSASSHECTGISTCLQKWKWKKEAQTLRKSSGAHQHACMHAYRIIQAFHALPFPQFLSLLCRRLAV